MAFLLKSYLRVLERRPLVTQSVTAGILMATGDAIAQFGVERKTITEYQPERGARFLVFGTFFVGPLLRGWYLILDKYCLGTPKVAALKKIAVDQSLMAPAFLSFFLGTMEYWKCRSVDEAKKKIETDFVPVLLTNYKIWPAAQLINFYFIPFQHRIMYVQIVAIFWNTYLSWKSEASPETSDGSSAKTPVIPQTTTASQKN